jgi:hypothetical protein
MIALLIFMPIVVVVAAAYLFYRALRTAGVVSWRNISFGASLLLAIFCECIVLETLGLGPVALTQIMLTAIASVTAGIVLAIKLPHIKIWTGLLVSLVFIGILLIGFSFGLQYTPDAIISRNGQSIAAALRKYYEAAQKYPAALNELVPKYLDSLHEPRTTGGWLYQVEVDDFTLGYVVDVDKSGYLICTMKAASTKWNCLQDSETPFKLGPTPTPTSK